MVFTKKAFTLSELMVVIAVIAILMAAAVPTFIGARRRSEASACRANLEVIKSAINEWALDNPDTAVANRAVLVSEIDRYISDGFDSLECEVGGRYSQGQGADATWDTTDDVVVTIAADGSIPVPTCSVAAQNAGHSID